MRFGGDSHFDGKGKSVIGKTILSLCLVIGFWMTMANSASPRHLPRVEPVEASMNGERLNAIDDVVQAGLRGEKMPGAVVLVAHQGKTVYLRAFGHRQVEPCELPMQTDTVFDMASLTKPIATATSVMKLIEMEKVQLDAPVADYLPEFGQNGKQAVTVFQLLTHQGGLTPDNTLNDYANGPEAALERIWQLPLIAEPGSRFIYSDVGFIVLAELVKRVSGKDIHQFTQQHVFAPLGMGETGYLPAEPLRERAATTEQREGHWMRGEVHDPRAYRLGGIAGHAGLFSTAEDLAIYGQMLLQQGRYGDQRILRSATVQQMTDAYTVPGGKRGLGWDKRSGYSSNRGDLFSPRAFGHGGFTGTSMWIDPEQELIVIFLSNRVHPDGKGSVNALAGRIGTIAAAAVCDDTWATDARQSFGEVVPVMTGIDVLEEGDFAKLAGAKVGLITNQTGINRLGRSTIEILASAEQLKLRALFSPEHGLEGRLDVAKIGDTREDNTGLPVFSLYGENRSPTPESLEGLDTLVFDIQDIGARFYTYISTMGNAMRTAAEHDLRFVVLDRPNPINGVDVAGPVLDDGRQSFVGFHLLPVRHGMTVGELAIMFNAELEIGVDLTVIEVENWNRSNYFDRTGLMWVNPSPNMRSLNQAVLYPGIGLLETTNLSVGRGTDTPFEVIGAPWLDGIRLARTLNGANLPGVRFLPIRFTPRSSKFAEESCGGINISVVDRCRFDPLRTGLEIARQLRTLYPDEWQVRSFDRLLADQRVLELVTAAATVDQMRSSWEEELAVFRQRRQSFLLY